MKNIIAIIPARSGSKSVADKNIKILSGYPLIAYSIAVAKLCKNIDRVIVSTDSQKYAEIAKKYGAEVPFIRPSKFSKDTSTDKDFLIHAMEWIEENEGTLPEYWVHLRPTTPLRETLIIEKAIENFIQDKSATSLRSGHKAPESPLKWFIKRNNYFKGLVEGERYNLPKESFEQIYIPNGYVDILRASYVMKNSGTHGDKIIGYVSPACIEVDSIEEFEYIQYQLEKNHSKLLDYLKTIKS
jgi:N-acylneuraminate cytidylyltransferase